MKSERLTYFLIIISIIILGVTSRKLSFIPLCIGDTLYAILIYFIIRIVFPKQSKIKTAFFSLIICYFIEFTQLYKSNWLNEIRETQLGHYVLGQGFLWSDIIAYSVGVFIAFIFNKYFLKFR